MTETDSLKQPLCIPVNFVPYLEKHRIYQLFKDISRDVILHLPKDHLKHIKTFLINQTKGGKDTHRIMLLVSPEVIIDKKKLIQEIIKDVGFAVITRPIIMDFFLKHDDYVKGCMSPVLLAKVTKSITMKEPVAKSGWIMMDHPCSLREARCLQQEGVLPSVTLLLVPPPTVTAAALVSRPSCMSCVQRDFNQQDIDALRHVYNATLKEVIVNPGEAIEHTAVTCFSAIRACAEGAQGPGQGYHMLGSLGVYRILLIGPKGSGRRTQARLTAKRFNVVQLNFMDIYREATLKKDKIAKELFENGSDVNLIADIINRRILEKDCLDRGWIMTHYPAAGMNVNIMENVKTPPNRIIFLNVEWETCQKRVLARGVDWCTGQSTMSGNGPRIKTHAEDQPETLKYELDFYFTEALSELRTAAGMMTTQVDASLPIEQVQVQMEAAIMAASTFDAEQSAQLRNSSAEIGQHRIVNES